MRKLNWANIQASTDGEFEQLPPGGYVVRILDMIDNDSKEYVEVVWDIAEGQYKDRYSDEWGKSHPYAHHLFMSYKDAALGMLKGRLEAIQASNPGFDPFAAWDAGRLDMFRSRLVGINLQEEEYMSRDDQLRTRMNVCQVVPADDVRQGKVKVRQKKKLEGQQGGTTSSSPMAAPARPASYAPVDEDSIPF